MIYKILEKIRGSFDNVINLIDEGKYDEAKEICKDMHFGITGLVALGKEKAQKTEESGFNYEKFAAEHFFGIPAEDMKPAKEQDPGAYVKDGYIYWDKFRLDNKSKFEQWEKDSEEKLRSLKELKGKELEDFTKRMLDESAKQKKELEELEKKFASK